MASITDVRVVQGDLHADILNTMIKDIQEHEKDLQYEAHSVTVQPDATYDFRVECRDFPNAPKETRDLTAHLAQEMFESFGPSPPGTDLLHSPYIVRKLAKRSVLVWSHS